MNHRVLLQQLIRKTLAESAVFDLPDNHMIHAEIVGDRDLEIEIRVPGVQRAHFPGNMRLQRIQTKDGEMWEVVNSSARKGWGPMLYDIAMELVASPDHIAALGIIPDRMMVSNEARNIWQHYFSSRSDVEHEPMPPRMIVSHGDGAGTRPDFLNFYYYKLDTPLLDKLVSSGQLKLSGFS